MMKINDMTQKQMQEHMWKVHADMETSNHEQPLVLTADEYAAVMVALEIAGEM